MRKKNINEATFVNYEPLKIEAREIRLPDRSKNAWATEEPAAGSKLQEKPRLRLREYKEGAAKAGMALQKGTHGERKVVH